MKCSTQWARIASWTRWRNFGRRRGPYRQPEEAFSHSSDPTVDTLERQFAMRCLMLAMVKRVGRCLSLKFWQNVRLIVGLVWVENVDSSSTHNVNISAEYQTRTFAQEFMLLEWSGLIKIAQGCRNEKLVRISLLLLSGAKPCGRATFESKECALSRCEYHQ